MRCPCRPTSPTSVPLHLQAVLPLVADPEQAVAERTLASVREVIVQVASPAAPLSPPSACASHAPPISSARVTVEWLSLPAALIAPVQPFASRAASAQATYGDACAAARGLPTDTLHHLRRALHNLAAQGKACVTPPPLSPVCLLSTACVRH